MNSIAEYTCRISMKLIQVNCKCFFRAVGMIRGGEIILKRQEGGTESGNRTKKMQGLRIQTLHEHSEFFLLATAAISSLSPD
ncbi:MAG: hypothetical protein D3904_10985 [Candidatus Electrothrix sp. EH2]|nr:hypothetical protein [Candidatus Electrothrix sp. EH2]